MPESMKGKAVKGMCRWCDLPVLDAGKPTKLTWHPECVATYKVIFWPAETRRAVLERDGGVCASCGRDTVAWLADKYSWQGRRGLDDWLLKAEAKSRFGHWWTDEKRTWMREQERLLIVERGWPVGDESVWQHDHIVCLKLADPNDLSYWRLGNIQTLCTPCHKRKTKEDLKAIRASKQRVTPDCRA